MIPKSYNNNEWWNIIIINVTSLYAIDYTKIKTIKTTFGNWFKNIN
jgi:hypothetical protein